MDHWIVKLIFSLIGGLGLFLFGMHLLSDGLKRGAGDRLRHILALLTRTRLIAILTGVGATCVLQSSSATTVMIVGFVNAGLLELRQAIATVMGANIGTTITAWLVALISALKAVKISLYALPLVGVGFLTQFLAHRRSIRAWGQVLLALGLLILGLRYMEEAFSLKGPQGAGQEAFRQMVVHTFQTLGRYPILAVLVGALVTMIAQSSSATIGVIQLMAVQGLIGLDASLALILGTNIGTTITAEIASIGGTLAARRTARAHTLFNVFGTLYVLPLLYLVVPRHFVLWLAPGATIAAHIAIFHSTFNVISTVVQAPLINFLERASIRLVPDRAGGISGRTKHLEPHLLATPTLALDGARREIVQMTEMAGDAIEAATNGILQKDLRQMKSAEEYEVALDSLQREVTQYLIELSRRRLDRAEADRLPVLLHAVNDLERIGDHAVNLAEAGEMMLSDRITFSDLATSELQQVKWELLAMFADTLEGLRMNDHDAARRALNREEHLNELQALYRHTHARRLEEKACGVRAGLVFLEIINNLEKVGDHLKNINQALLGSFHWQQVKGNGTKH